MPLLYFPILEPPFSLSLSPCIKSVSCYTETAPLHPLLLCTRKGKQMKPRRGRTDGRKDGLHAAAAAAAVNFFSLGSFLETKMSHVCSFDFALAAGRTAPGTCTLVCCSAKPPKRNGSHQSFNTATFIGLYSGFLWPSCRGQCNQCVNINEILY